MAERKGREGGGRRGHRAERERRTIGVGTSCGKKEERQRHCFGLVEMNGGKKEREKEERERERERER